MEKTFTFTGARKIVFGCGALNGLSQLLTELKVSRPYIVMDPALANTEVRERLCKKLEREHLSYTLFTDVEAEPSLELADKCALKAQESGADGSWASVVAVPWISRKRSPSLPHTAQKR